VLASNGAKKFAAAGTAEARAPFCPRMAEDLVPDEGLRRLKFQGAHRGYALVPWRHSWPLVAATKLRSNDSLSPLRKCPLTTPPLRRTCLPMNRAESPQTSAKPQLLRSCLWVGFGFTWRLSLSAARLDQHQHSCGWRPERPRSLSSDHDKLGTGSPPPRGAQVV